MAQLYYRYSTMGAGKSIELLKIAYNYEEQGKKVLLFTSAIDKRFGEGRVSSRVGLSREAIVLSADTDLYQAVLEQAAERPNCVLIDECQFMSKNQVIGAARVVDCLNIPVICYGLKNDFQNNLFTGSEALLLYADKIEEVKTVCWYCDKKGTMVLRLNNGVPIFEGQQIQIGGNENYVPVCRKCWMKAQAEYLNCPKG